MIESPPFPHFVWLSRNRPRTLQYYYSISLHPGKNSNPNWVISIVKVPSSPISSFRIISSLRFPTNQFLRRLQYNLEYKTLSTDLSETFTMLSPAIASSITKNSKPDATTHNMIIPQSINSPLISRLHNFIQLPHGTTLAYDNTIQHWYSQITQNRATSSSTEFTPQQQNTDTHFSISCFPPHRLISDLVHYYPDSHIFHPIQHVPRIELPIRRQPYHY